MWMIRRVLWVAMLTGCGANIAAGQVPDAAGEAFERHNYKIALEELEAYLLGDPSEPARGEARVMRAQCMLRLRKWAEGIAAAEEVFDEYPQMRRRADLHLTLADAALQRHQFKAVAIDHLRTAVDLLVSEGETEAAAEAAIKCGGAFVHFNDWQKLEGFDDQPTKDWRVSRRRGREMAVLWLDRGIELTANDALAAAATLRKAGLFHRDLRFDDADLDKAVKIYRDVERRWPNAKEAASAGFQIARLLEQHRHDYVAAAAQYQSVVERYPRSRYARRATESLKNILAPVVRIGVEGPVVPGENGRVEVEVRNVERVRFEAYRVDLFALVREIGHPSRLDDWSPRGVPVTTWTLEVPDTGEHKHYSSRQETLPATALPIADAGAYVILASRVGLDPPAGKSARAKAMMIVSNLAAVSKGAKNSALIWATDATTGVPTAGADVLIQEMLGRDDYRYREADTNEVGVCHVAAGRRTKHGGFNPVSLYLQKGANYALCGASFHWYSWGYANDYRVYSFTDRPVYRPDQVIHFKHILRRYQAGDYHNVAHKKIGLTLSDPQGEVVDERDLVTNEHGTVTGSFDLPSRAPLGIYRTRILIDGKNVSGGGGASFRVEEYRKPEYEVTVSAGSTRYAVDEPVDVRIEARYYFGSPVADAAVEYTVYRETLYPRYPYPTPYPWYFDQLASWWRDRDARRIPPFCRGPRWQARSLVQRGELRTDDEGVAMLRVTPDGSNLQAGGVNEDYRLIVEAEVTDSSRRTVTGSGSVNVTRAPFTLRLSPQRHLYQPGDNVHIDVHARGPNDEPVPFDGTIRVHRLVRRDVIEADGTTRQALEPGDVVAEAKLSAGATGDAVFRWVADQERPFRFEMTVYTADGQAITGSCDVWIARAEGRLSHYAYRDVELIPEKYVYEIGERAKILLTSSLDEADVLITFEADQLLDQRVVHVTGGGKVIEFPIESHHAPNFYVTATLLHDNKVFQDKVAIVVPPTRQFLSVDIESESQTKTFSPGEDAEFTITTADADGRGVDAEVAIMMVDASLYYIQSEFREKIERYFYGRVRPHIVSTQTSFDWSSGQVRSYGMNRFADVRTMTMAGAPQAAEGAVAKMASANGDGPEFVVPEIRRDFPDSVVWAGQVNTGADGRETLNVTFPDSLTTWRLIAIAVDDLTRVGEASRDLVTRKDVIARLETPRFLVEGDQPLISVIARNDLPSAKTMRITLEATGPVSVGTANMDGRRVPMVKPGTCEMTIEPGGERTIDFEVNVSSPGTATFTATVATDVAGDAMETRVPVVAFGAPKLVTRTGVIRDGDTESSQTVSFTLPDEMNPDTPILEVHLSPTVAGVMLDAIPYLLEYPYGCTEQTMSRLLPAVVTRAALERFGVNLADLAARAREQAPPGRREPWRWRNHPVFNDGVLDDIVHVGLTRLTELQHADGGWGWWTENESDPYMTAYVVYGLAEARRAKVRVDPKTLERGVSFLTARVADPLNATARRPARNEANVRTWMLYALSTAEALLPAQRDIRAAIDAAFDNRDALTDYTRAMLAIVCHRAHERDRARIVVENLENTVRRDSDADTASWGRDTGYYRWYHNGLEATAMVLRALLATSPEHPDIPRAANWLIRNRKGSHWHSTKDTALAIYALAEYLEASGELDADMTVTVTLDDRLERSFRITPENLLTFDARIIYAPRHLTPGPHTIRIDRQGSGFVYHSTYVDYYTKEDPITPAGLDIRVQRTYQRLIAKEVQRTRPVWDAAAGRYTDQPYRTLEYDRVEIVEGESLEAGTLIEVELTIEAGNAFDYIMIEDPKPAGCEPVDLHSGAAYGRSLWTHIELRDRHVALFAAHMPQGKHKLTYRLRCETPGSFRVLPTQVEGMYSPYLRANGASDRITINP